MNFLFSLSLSLYSLALCYARFGKARYLKRSILIRFLTVSETGSGSIRYMVGSFAVATVGKQYCTATAVLHCFCCLARVANALEHNFAPCLRWVIFAFAAGCLRGCFSFFHCVFFFLLFYSFCEGSENSAEMFLPCFRAHNDSFNMTAWSKCYYPLFLSLSFSRSSVLFLLFVLFSLNVDMVDVRVEISNKLSGFGWQGKTHVHFRSKPFSSVFSVPFHPANAAFVMAMSPSNDSNLRRQNKPRKSERF